MPARPCNDHITGCPCINDDPFANLSSEAPDPIDVIRMAWMADTPRSNSPENYWNVPIGVGACSAADAQTAQDCARRAAVIDGHPDQTTYGNATTACTIACPDGSLFSFAVAPNTFLADSQSEADAIASSYCRFRASQVRTCAPAVVTGSATNTVGTSARMNGTVNPNGASTTVFFEWGSTTAYGNLTPVTAVGFGNVMLPFFADVTGLPGTVHYRIVAVSSQGTSRGADVTINLATLPTPLVWWKMEEAGAGNRLDTIHGLAFVPGGPFGTIAGIAGKIGNAIQISGASPPAAGLDKFIEAPPSPGFSAFIPYTQGNGMDITFWMKVSGANFSFDLVWNNNDAGGSFMDLIYRPSFYGANLALQWDGAYQALSPWALADGAWHFYRIFLDATNFKIGVQVDNGAIVTAPYDPLFDALNAVSGEVALYVNSDGAPPNSITLGLDEIALWPRKLTDAEATILYNSGSGKTCCPIT